MKIELHKQFKVPVDGLIPMAEEIVKIKEKKKAEPNQPFVKVEKQVTFSETVEEKSAADGAEQLDPRKAAKKALKEEKR